MVAVNAIKHIGSHNLVVKSNIRKKYVRNIIRFWIQQARSNLLHDIRRQAQRADSYHSGDTSILSKSNTALKNIF